MDRAFKCFAVSILVIWFREPSPALGQEEDLRVLNGPGGLSIEYVDAPVRFTGMCSGT